MAHGAELAVLIDFAQEDLANLKAMEKDRTGIERTILLATSVVGGIGGLFTGGTAARRDRALGGDRGTGSGCCRLVARGPG